MTLPGIETSTKAATISEDGLYRYTLTRAWDSGLPSCNFVMLNPSTADATDDDNTIIRCVGFAREWGYGAIVVTNLYAYRSTLPGELYRAPDPIGPHNDHHVDRAARSAGMVVCAWGNHGAPSTARATRHPAMTTRAANVRALILDAGRWPRVLRLTSIGQPWHPLYLPATLTPVPWGAGPLPR